jgi:hypothetical protein
MLVFREDDANMRPSSLHGREHVFDVRAAYAEHVTHSSVDEPLDEQICEVHDFVTCGTFELRELERPNAAGFCSGSASACKLAIRPT